MWRVLLYLILCAREIIEGDIIKFVFLKDPLSPCGVEHGLNKGSKPEAQVEDYCSSSGSGKGVSAKRILEVKLMGLELD